MDIDVATQKKIQELQMLEHNLQNTSVEKQTLQVQANELTNALHELTHAGDEVYRMTGGIMLRADKAKLKEELSERKKVLDLKISSVEKHEKQIETKARALRTEITSTMNLKK